MKQRRIDITIKENGHPVTGLELGDFLNIIDRRVESLTEVSPGNYFPVFYKSNITMQPHTKNYFKAFNIDFDPATGWHDFISCEMCDNEAVDLHHIEKRIKGVKRLDHHKNIIALCRVCHEKAHANKYAYTKDCLQTRHENNMRIHNIDF